MELKHLETFLCVARHLHFTRAAEELGYVQSSVTAHIKALETELGVPLFERLGRRVLLTEPGKELCAHARSLLGQAEQTREAVRCAGDDPGQVRGTLRIAAPESLCAHHLPPVLRAVRERFPQLRLAFQPAGRGPLLDALAEGTIDAGFLQEEAVREPGVRAERMLREPLRLIAAAGHPLASAERVTTADLAGETVLLLEAGCAQRIAMERELSRAGLRPPTVEFFSLEALRRCVAAGLGVGLAPAASVAGEAGRGELAVLPWVEEPALDVFFVRRAEARTTRAVRELADLARAHWGAGPGAGAGHAGSRRVYRGPMEIWINPACSKCRSAVKLLEAEGAEYTVRRYLDDPPTEGELRDVLGRLGLEPWDITRTGEAVAKELGLGEWPREAAARERWVAALAAHPKLIQRPIITADDGTAVVARTDEAVRGALGS